MIKFSANKTIKALFAFLLISIIGTALLNVAAQKFNTSIYINAVIKQIEDESMTSSISIGSYSINLFPLKITLKGVRIEYNISGYDKLTILTPIINISPRIGPLFSGNIEIKTIELKDSQISTESIDISSLISGLFLQKKQSQIQKIKISNATLNTKQQIKANNIDIIVKKTESSTQVNGKANHISGKKISIKSNYNKNKENESDLDLNLSVNEYRLKFTSTIDRSSKTVYGETIGYRKNEQKQKKEDAPDTVLFGGEISGHYSENKIFIKTNDIKIKTDSVVGIINMGIEGQKIDIKIALQKLDADKLSIAIKKDIASLSNAQVNTTNIFNTKIMPLIIRSISNDRQFDIAGNIAIMVDRMILNNQTIRDTRMNVILKNGLIESCDLKSILPHRTLLEEKCKINPGSQSLYCIAKASTKNAIGFLKWSGIEYPLSSIIENKLNLYTQFIITKNLLTIQNLIIKIDNTKILSQAMIKNIRDKITISGDLKVQSDQINHFARLLANTANKTQGRLNRRESIVKMHSHPISYNMNISLSTNKTKTDKKPNGISFHLKYKEKSFRVDRIQVYYDEIGDIDGYINIGINKLNIVMDSYLNSNKLVINKIVDIFATKKEEIKNDDLISIAEKIGLILKKPISILNNANITINLNNILMDKIDVGSLGIRLKIKRNSLDAKLVNSKIFGGKLKYASKTTITNAGIITRGKFSINNANCADSYRAISGKNSHQSYCSIGGVFMQNIQKNKHWIDGITGKAQWSLVETYMPIIDMELLSNNILKVSSKSELISLLDTAILGQKNYPIGSINGASEIKKGSVISKFKISGDGFSGSGASQLVLKNWFVNNRIKFLLMPYGSLTPIELDLEVKGALQENLETSFDIDKTSRLLNLRK